MIEECKTGYVKIARIKSGRFTLRKTFDGTHLMWQAPMPDIDQLVAGKLLKDTMRSLRCIMKGLTTRRNNFPIAMSFCIADEYFLATLAPGSYRVVSGGREVEWLDKPTTGPRLQLEPEVASAISKPMGGLAKGRRVKLDE